jgi:phosphatidylglycerol:prolipoprotein diacylglycerol transferase
MHPHIFGLQAYAVFTVAAALVGLSVTLHLGWRAGLPRRRFVVLQVLLLAAALAGARAHGLLEGVARYGFTARALGVATYRYPGGLVAWLVALLLLGPRLSRPLSLAGLADVVAPATGCAMAVARIGCFLHGCCYGVPTTLPWGVRFPAPSIPWNDQMFAGLVTTRSTESLAVHPLQVYFAAWSIAVTVVVLALGRRKSYDGQTFLRFFALHEGGKALLEFLRGPRPLLHLQLPSLAVCVLATAVLAVRAFSTAPAKPLPGRTP